MKPLAALRALGPGADAPEEAKQRVHAALLASLVGAAAGQAAVAAIPKATASLSPAAVPALASLTGSKASLLAVGIWLFGGATGAVLYGALQHEQLRVVYVDRPVPAIPVSAAVPAASPPNALSEAVPSAAPSSKGNDAQRGVLATGTLGGVSELSRERALLDLARASATRGEPGLVLEQVARHRRQFPQGKLAEEREALAIRALLALGRGDEARARAGAFRNAYPNSFLLPVIDSALSTP